MKFPGSFHPKGYDLERTLRSPGAFGLMERWLSSMILRELSALNISVVLWNGEEIPRGIRLPAGKLRLRSRRALPLLCWHPEYYFGELYCNGEIEVEGDLRGLLETGYRRLPAVRRSLPWVNCADFLRRHFRKPDFRHYELDARFFEMWLDPQYVQYSCAYYENPQMSLQAAQIAKLDYLCRKLRLRPGQRVVEAGCGWGGLARYMAKFYGVTVTAYNVSKTQLAYAREHAGLSDRVSYVQDDFRNIRGEYDAFVSVGMLEHVGLNNYERLGAVIDRVLKPDGRGLIHSIGRNRRAPLNPWIEQRIFPGAYAPTPGEICRILQPFSFSILDLENIRLHYVKTLEHWLEAVRMRADDLKEAVNADIYRAWLLYLTGSLAAFTVGDLQLFQIVFARQENNDLPWTRADLYRGP